MIEDTGLWPIGFILIVALFFLTADIKSFLNYFFDCFHKRTKHGKQVYYGKLKVSRMLYARQLFDEVTLAGAVICDPYGDFIANFLITKEVYYDRARAYIESVCRFGYMDRSGDIRVCIKQVTYFPTCRVYYIPSSNALSDLEQKQ